MNNGALLERTAELGRLDDAIKATLRGTGTVMVLEGPAGIGKTALAGAALDAAGAAGLLCGRAVGGPLEWEFPFGATRQLLRPLLDIGTDGVLAGAATPAAGLLGLAQPGRSEPEGVLLHALFWLVANVAEQRPLLLLADDAHWFDLPSLHFLAYLARRIADLPVLLIVASRPADTEPVAELLGELLSDPSVELIQPPPLTGDAIAALVKDRLGDGADEAFCAACADAAAGNPFLTLSLVDALADAGVRPTAASAADVIRIGAAGAGRAILRRLHTLPPDAREVARAVAILGSDAQPRLVAELAGCDLPAAVEALVRAGLLVDERPLRLAHPLVHAAVHDETGPTRRSTAHARAARLLAEAPDGTRRAATHLLATDPAADEWTVDILVGAAESDTAHGTPASAATLLDRALAEPPSPARRPEILAALGKAEVLAGLSGAEEHLRAALAVERDPGRRIEIAFALRRALVSAGRGEDAIRTLIDLHAEVGADPVAATKVETYIVQAGINSAAAAPLAAPYAKRLRARADLPPDALGLASLLALAANEPAGQRLAEDCVNRWRAEAPDDAPMWIAYPTAVLVTSDHQDAHPVLSWALGVARREGDIFLTGNTLENIAWWRLKVGELAAAEADIRTCGEAYELCGTTVYLDSAIGIHCEILTERGDLDAAERLIAGLGPIDAPRSPAMYLAMGRARLRLAQGRLAEAAADLRFVGDLCLGVSIITPAWLPWRAELAEALSRLGQTDEAVRIASEDLDLARQFGTPRVIGTALRGLGVATGSIDLLREAVEVLEPSPARLETLRARLALGTLLRQRGAKSDARTVLTRALDLAGDCGAALAAERARAELVAAGARPRRTRTTGRDALTPTELRVAGLAAANTNREIAQAMFLTVKTVETHLRNTYQKLGITGRPELAAALGKAT
jgi:DNA-binding CsgD family transcriptional regulator